MAETRDLWEELLILYGKHTVRFSLIKIHYRFRESLWCSQLAVQAIHFSELKVDRVCEKLLGC